jgi:hypothetical protein
VAQHPHAADVHVNASLIPSVDCKVGQEIVWPVVGDIMLWRITEADDGSVVARSGQSKDILIFCPGRMVPVVTGRAHPQQNWHRYQGSGASSTNTFGAAFGNGFGFTSA